jgi:16S rRNA (cytosine1402-N4)-methyltransferase
MYHIPALLTDTLKALAIKPNGRYADFTFGGGGHSRAILENLSPDGKLYAFDQDPDAVQNIMPDERLQFFAHNFKDALKVLQEADALPLDGILADLGVSFHQFDTAHRGFSIRFADAPLDMRMNPSLEHTAADIVNHYPPQELHQIFKMYGELPKITPLVRRIVTEREKKPIETVRELKEVLMPFCDFKKETQFWAQVFQALRIEVNKELDSLKQLLLDCEKMLKPGGRIVIISYHSLEDRLVKRWFKTSTLTGKMPQDMFGNPIDQYFNIPQKMLTPNLEEINQNPRSRSAKLRVAERL